MTILLKNSLNEEFNKINGNNQMYHHGKDIIFNEFKDKIIDESMMVISELRANPYLSAKEISKKRYINIRKFKLIYKIIQRSDSVQKFFRKSQNRDYFQVVEHYFNKSLYTVVFFVGTNCPSRCIFCPNVHIDENGKRRLKIYDSDASKLINEKHLEKIFSDLGALKNKGTNILVKISGGLEPLTDIKTVNIIISLAKQIKIPVKMFTNGLLFNSATRREAALEASDIRISLSTTDDDQYSKICFDNSIPKGKGRALTRLKKSIGKLLTDRERLNKPCKVGINSIILPDNHHEIEKLMDLTSEIGADYIDFKPDYFSTYDNETEELLNSRVEAAKEYADHFPSNRPFINFTDSNSRSNIYWNNWQGYCNCIKQSDYKIFITPYGDCSPVHYGAFPEKSDHSPKYSIGKIDNNSSLLDVLSKPVQSPTLELKKLNPFELMLNLEIKREEEDRCSGIPLSCSPYHTSLRDMIPDTIL